MGDAAAGLLPDFRAGAVVMGFRVVAIGELVENLAAAFALQLVGQIRAPSMPSSLLTRISSAP